MSALFAALGFAVGIVLAAYRWPGWQMTVAAAGLGGLSWFAQRHGSRALRPLLPGNRLLKQAQ